MQRWNENDPEKLEDTLAAVVAVKITSSESWKNFRDSRCNIVEKRVLEKLEEPVRRSRRCQQRDDITHWQNQTPGEGENDRSRADERKWPEVEETDENKGCWRKDSSYMSGEQQQQQNVQEVDWMSEYEIEDSFRWRQWMQE